MSSSYTLLPFEAQRAFVYVISEVADAIKKGVDSLFLVKREEGRGRGGTDDDVTFDDRWLRRQWDVQSRSTATLSFIVASACSGCARVSRVVLGGECRGVWGAGHGSDVL